MIDFNKPVLTDLQFKALSRPEKRRYLKTYVGNKRWRLNNIYKIENERGRVVTFKFRDAQKELFDSAHTFELILKARQLGFSTYIDIYALDECLFNKNYKAGIIAQDLDSAGAIFQTKVLFPYEQLPSYIRSRITVKQKQGGANGGALKFSNGSSIRVATSFRSGTLQFLHISELGRICAGAPLKAREIQTGSIPTVHAGSKLVIESTAEGAAGLFFDLCKKSEEHKMSGLPLGPRDFNFRFIPWFTHPNYKSPVPKRGLKLSKFFRDYFLAVEQATGVTLSDNQKQWYVETYQKYEEHTKQEYPSTPQEAFLTSGRRRFSAIHCMRAEGECSKPLIVYDVETHLAGTIKTSEKAAEAMIDVRNEVNRDGKSEQMQKGLMGYLLVWELPDEEQDYAIGADVAEGLEHGDRSSLDVCNSNGEQVAHWYGHIEPDEFAKLIAIVGRFYNSAFVGPERNNHGHAVMNTLRDVYPTSRIYVEEYHDRDDEREETQKLGWLTTRSSKPIIVSNLDEELRNSRDGINWIGTISEMNTYVYDERGSTNAISGAFDDQVMSYAIAKEMVVRMPRTINKDYKSIDRSNDWRQH
ncbi:terminase [Aliivibrio fischeri]|uniref:terminase n=1 Tax=Aliivibrio fischeri TaxID=668 RepID=UPI001F395BBD|nr:terminase [Aliivibrio fischeri]MCE7567546.1 terminase [Aliivibrio fischeri]